MTRLILCFLSLVIFGCSNQSNDSSGKNYFPETEWAHEEDPHSKGWDLDRLRNLDSFIADSCHTTGMLIVHRGKIVFTYGDIHQSGYIASCRKSILAMLYGPFVANGRIDLNTTIEDLKLDDMGGLLPIEKKATIEHLLTSRSGVYHPASNPGDQSAIAPKRGSVVPGTSWLYNNWDFNIAGHILEKQTGKNIYDLLDSVLARPLQMQDWAKSIQRKAGDSSKSIYPAYPMWLSTEDMARIGYLMLREGNWNGNQVIPREWVRRIVTPVTTYAEALHYKRNYAYFGYGYMWWCWDNPENSGIYSDWYTAMGAFGQFITVFPKLDLVIVHSNNSMATETSIDTYLKIVLKILAARNFVEDLNL